MKEKKKTGRRPGVKISGNNTGLNGYKEIYTGHLDAFSRQVHADKI